MRALNPWILINLSRTRGKFLLKGRQKRVRKASQLSRILLREKSQYKVLLTIPGVGVTTATASSCFPGPQGRAQPDLVVDLSTILCIGDIYAVGQHAVKTPVILDQARRVCPCNFPDGLFNRIRRDVRIDILNRGLESSDQYDLIVIITFTGRDEFGAGRSGLISGPKAVCQPRVSNQSIAVFSSVVSEVLPKVP